MDVTQGLQSLLAVFLVAAVTPLIAAALPGPRIPQVVFFLVDSFEDIVGRVEFRPAIKGCQFVADIARSGEITVPQLFHPR